MKEHESNMNLISEMEKKEKRIMEEINDADKMEDELKNIMRKTQRTRDVALEKFDVKRLQIWIFNEYFFVLRRKIILSYKIILPFLIMLGSVSEIKQHDISKSLPTKSNEIRYSKRNQQFIFFPLQEKNQIFIHIEEKSNIERMAPRVTTINDTRFNNLSDLK